MATERVRYRERQPLRRADLETEQAYRIDLRRRHVVGPHDWGIVAGLELTGMPLTVTPGFAVDGYGRELAVPRALPVPTWDQIVAQLGAAVEEAGAADLWLLYGRFPQQVAARGAFDCGPGQEGRWREEAVLRATPADASLDPRQPPGTPESEPQRTPPDDPAVEWPIYLGTVSPKNSRVRGGGPVVGLRGQQVVAASRSARMQLHNERAGDRVRFGVFTADAPRWTTDREGNAAIAGNAALGDAPDQAARVTVEPPEGASRPAGVVFGALAEPPAQASPWRIYRAPDPDRPLGGELRIELAAPAGKTDRPQNGVTIGAFDEDGDWTPCLTVADDGSATVRGDLYHSGTVSVAPIDANPLDKRFQAVLKKFWLQGVLDSESAANGELTTRVDQSATPVPLGDTLTITGDVSNANASAESRILLVEVRCKVDDQRGDPGPVVQFLGTIAGAASKPFTFPFTLPDDFPQAGGTLKIDVIGQGLTGRALRALSAQRTVALVNQLDRAVQSPASVEEEGSIDYTLSVTNRNRLALTDVSATVVIQDDGASTTTSVAIGDLAAGDDPLELPLTYTVRGSAGDTVTIRITLKGKIADGAAFTPIALDAVSVTITAAGPGGGPP